MWGVELKWEMRSGVRYGPSLNKTIKNMTVYGRVYENTMWTIKWKMKEYWWVLFWGRRLWASCMPLCGFLLTPPKHPLGLDWTWECHKNMTPNHLTILDHAVQSSTHNWTLFLFPKTLDFASWILIDVPSSAWDISFDKVSEHPYRCTGLALALLKYASDSTCTHASPALPHKVHLELRADLHMLFSTLISHFSLQWAGCLAISNNISDLTYYVKIW